MAKPRLHLVGIFHTKAQLAFSHCAFTGKALRFPKMMQANQRMSELLATGSENEWIALLSPGAKTSAVDARKGLFQSSEERPLGEDGKPDPRYLSEAGAVRTMISAPDTVAKFGGKFIPVKKPAAQPAAAGGLPAVQAQAPAAAAQAEARTILPEAEGLYKQLSAIEAQEEKISSSEKQNRIKQINKEIESLQKSATQKYSGFGLPGAGKLKTGSKERRDIERDILRVEQLVAERNRLEGKTQTAKSQFNSQEDVIKAIKSGQLTREQGKTILQNQFGLQ